MHKSRDELTNNRPSRREFIQRGAILAGTSIFAFRHVLAAAKKAGKPPFTISAVNQWCASRSPEEYRAMCAEANRDLKGFVLRTFYLTPGQETTVARLTAEHERKLNAILSQTLKDGSRFKLVVHVLTPAEYAREKPSRDVTNGTGILAIRTHSEQMQFLKSQGRALAAEADSTGKGEANLSKILGGILGSLIGQPIGGAVAKSDEED